MLITPLQVVTFRMLLDAGTVIGLSDGQLLDLVESRGDETAFTALMERHGPMVRRACGEVLGNQHDAEDAFQKRKEPPTFSRPGKVVGPQRHWGVRQEAWGVRRDVPLFAFSVP
jgi:hypothetical protein